MSDSGPEAWQVQERRTLIDTPWLRLESHRVRTPQGGEIPDYHVIREPSWALAIPVLPDGRLVVVEQYRHGIGRAIYEFPAGDCDGEDPAQAVLRELAEETGYRPRPDTRPQPLGRFHTDPSRSDNTGHAFVVRVAADPGPCDPDTHEDIAVRRLHPAELWAGLESGRWCHGVHVACLAAAEREGLLTP